MAGPICLICGKPATDNSAACGICQMKYLHMMVMRPPGDRLNEIGDEFVDAIDDVYAELLENDTPHHPSP